MAKLIETVVNKIKVRYEDTGKIEKISQSKLLGCTKIVNIFTKDIVGEELAKELCAMAAPHPIFFRPSPSSTSGEVTSFTN